MSLSFELFAAGPASPEALWAVVGDPTRLPEWTDVEAVEQAPDALAEGAQVIVRAGGATWTWQVVTCTPRLWEARTATPAQRLGIGARVVREANGSRLVLAGEVAPAGLRARMLTVPRLRARFDRWARAAHRAASTP